VLSPLLFTKNVLKKADKEKHDPRKRQHCPAPWSAQLDE